MGFTCGIIGLPNIGKTTIFNALTGAHVEATRYASTSTQPNTRVVPVPDPRMDTICALVEAEKVIYTTLEFVDIAGLAKGASRGEGLGNKFLAHIREVDAIAHIVRCFEDPNLPHPNGKVDPQTDIETINTELIIADLEALDRRKQKLEKVGKSGDQDARAQLDLIRRIIETLDAGQPARALHLSTEMDKRYLKEYNLLTSIPVLYVCNIQEPAEAGNAHVAAVPPGLHAGDGTQGNRVVPDDPRRVRLARAGHLLYGGGEGKPGLDRSPQHPRSPGGGGDSFRFRKRIHPGGGV